MDEKVLDLVDRILTLNVKNLDAKNDIPLMNELIRVLELSDGVPKYNSSTKLERQVYSKIYKSAVEYGEKYDR